MQTYVFWFHYNKPASAAAQKPQITIHFKNKCLIVDNLSVKVPTHGHIRNEQPYFVIRGKCTDINIVNNIAYIV